MRRLLATGCCLALAVSFSPALTAPAGAAGAEVRIVRDGCGVPHIYGPTAESVAYGAGYAIAQDRLFQMDVLRAVAKGRLSELFGPVPGFLESDAATRRLLYTDDERRAKFERLSPRLRSMYVAYVRGVNDWIDEVRTDPSKLPQEYTQFGARAAGDESGCHDSVPGNVRDLDLMNRGTYNHLVRFDPGSAAESRPETGPLVEQRRGYNVRAQSIISPGQSGFINQLGQQDAHYEDQHELYETWRGDDADVRRADVIHGRAAVPRFT